MTASNHTYIFFPGPRSSTGIFIPQSKSLVIALSCSPSFTNDLAQLITCGRQPSCCSSQFPNSFSSEVSFKKKCSVSLNSALLPDNLLMGLISSSGSRVLLQLSH